MGAVMRAISCVALLALLGCTTPIRMQTLARGSTPLAKLAIVSAQPTARLTGDEGVEPGIAARIVTGRLLEALFDLRTFEVVPPAEVATALGASSGLDSLESNVLLHGTFGVQAVLRSKVSRFQQRVGGPRGAAGPAAVTFTLELSSADGVLLWRGTYEEIQQSLNEDPGSFSRARARGFRWVTAETLAGYGARELVNAIPGPSTSWK